MIDLIYSGTETTAAHFKQLEPEALTGWWNHSLSHSLA